MSRATYVLGGTTLLGLITSAWLYFDNRSLRSELAPADRVAEADPNAAESSDPWASRAAATGNESRSGTITPPPSLPAAKRENRNDRRARRFAEMSAVFGRVEGESDDDYKKRVMPMVTERLEKLRKRTTDMRRAAEEQAGVSKEQSAQLDQTFDKVYGEAIDMVNGAIKDGRVSPYKRDTANWLGVAGDFGAMLTSTQNQIGKILSPTQIKAMYDSGFEWGEYLGANAPWERLNPPPPPSP